MATSSPAGGDMHPAVSVSTTSLTNSPTLTTLVPHLLSARRSLSCVEQVSQANTLVRSSRQAIESQTALTARTLYIRNSSKAQIGTLEKVNHYVTAIHSEVYQEWEDVVRRVDEARERLGRTVEVLRQTKIEQKLRKQSSADEDEEASQSESSEKRLVDFVDETGIGILLQSIDDSGQAVSNAREHFDGSIQTLLQDTERVKLSLQDPTSRLEKFKDDPVRMTDLLQDMEQNAGEMAKNLESLVKHFDLCVTAIKHTEGGGAAATKIAKDLPGGFDIDLGDDEPLEEISEEEMQEIRLVIEKDAAEVDDVVAEIKAGLEEVHATGIQIQDHGQLLKNKFQQTASAFHLLKEVGSTLPAHITESQLFAFKWEEEKSKIEEFLIDLEGLRDFYMNFIEAYDNLLIEVGRRKDVEKRINKIRKEAMTKIDNLIDEEIEERRAFKSQQGDFLPVDIWPGLTLPPSRYEFVKVDDSGESIPDISASVISRAIKRVSQNRGKQS